jgi:hypothetical protein
MKNVFIFSSTENLSVIDESIYAIGENVPMLKNRTKGIL